MKEIQWTFMLYLSGDNNLSPDMVRTINDIASAGIPKDVALAIQYDPSSPSLPTLRYIITPGDPLSTHLNGGSVPVQSRATPVSGAENAASPAVLKDFVVTSLTELRRRGFIGRRRFLILSGHGSGAVGDFLTDGHVPARQLNSLSIPNLRDALSRAKRELAKDSDHREFAADVPLIHILGMDSCLMNMAEVCHEVRHARLNGVPDVSNKLVNCLVGSEGFVPRAGWPYGFLFQQLKMKPTPADSNEMSQCVVRDFVDFYRNYLAADVSVDIAACDLRKLDGLTGSLRKLTHTLRTHLDDPVIKDLVVLAHWRAQSFKFEQYTDLWDFCDLLNTSAKEVQLRFQALSTVLKAGSVALSLKDQDLLEMSVALVSQWQKVVGALKDIIEHTSAVNHAIEAVTRRDEDHPQRSTQESSGVDFQHAHGLSVYFPWQLRATPQEFNDYAGTEFVDLTPYKNLRFAKESGWASFLEKYLDATMRAPREIKNGKTIASLIAATAQNAPAVKIAGDDNRIAGDDNRIAGDDNRIAGDDNRIAGDDNRIAGDDNRIAGDDNRFLIQMFGGRMPWSMKNPPQQVEIEVRSEAPTAREPHG